LPVPNGLTAAALTGAGYTLANGVYSKSFGSILVSITLFTEAEGSGSAGFLQVVPNSDVTAADAANAAASLQSLGFTQLAGWPAGTFPISSAGGLQSAGISF
jgi:hypothetical protein